MANPLIKLPQSAQHQVFSYLKDHEVARLALLDKGMKEITKIPASDHAKLNKTLKSSSAVFGYGRKDTKRKRNNAERRNVSPPAPVFPLSRFKSPFTTAAAPLQKYPRPLRNKLNTFTRWLPTLVSGKNKQCHLKIVIKPKKPHIPAPSAVTYKIHFSTNEPRIINITCQNKGASYHGKLMNYDMDLGETYSTDTLARLLTNLNAKVMFEPTRNRPAPVLTESIGNIMQHILQNGAKLKLKCLQRKLHLKARVFNAYKRIFETVKFGGDVVIDTDNRISTKYSHFTENGDEYLKHIKNNSNNA